MIMKQGKRRDEAIMIIIDEEDQSSIMLASMLILDSSIFFSPCFKLYPPAFFLDSPCSSGVFASLALVCDVPHAGCGFPDQRLKRSVDRVSP